MFGTEHARHSDQRGLIKSECRRVIAEFTQDDSEVPPRLKHIPVLISGNLCPFLDDSFEEGTSRARVTRGVKIPGHIKAEDPDQWVWAFYDTRRVGVREQLLVARPVRPGVRRLWRGIS